MKDWSILKDLLLAALALVGGYFISAHFHKRQSIEREPGDNQIADALEKIYQQALRNGANASSVLYTLQSFRAQYDQETDLVEIKNKLDRLAQNIMQPTSRRDAAAPVEDVLQYKALGDRWSELVSSQLNLRVLDEAGHITVERLLAAHKSLFPDGFAWGGLFRKQAVFVIDTFGTSARIIDTAAAESRIATIPPESIGTNLTRLFNHWNTAIPDLNSATNERKIDEVAHFHHEFQLIHPFLDGNGRIGRMILEEQLSLLFGQHITFRPRRDEYLRGLRLLDLGEPDIFAHLLRDELAKFHVAL